MDSQAIEFLVNDLWSARAASLEQLRIIALKHGPVGPVGIGNSKVDLPVTYRRVGNTCPKYCGHWLRGTCYAMFGHTGMVMRRALLDVDSHVRSGAVAMVCAAKDPDPRAAARLHGAGDFLTEDGQLDTAYMYQLGIAAGVVRRLSGKAVVAFTYTHIMEAEHSGLGDALSWLASNGIVVRRSDVPGELSAMTITGEESNAERKALNAGVPMGQCPAQTMPGVTCRTCRICWERPDRGVGFGPEGMRKKETGRVAAQGGYNAVV